MGEAGDEGAVEWGWGSWSKGGLDEERDLWFLSIKLDDGGIVDRTGERLGDADADAEDWGESRDGADVDVQCFRGEFPERRGLTGGVERRNVGDRIEELVRGPRRGLVNAEEVPASYRRSWGSCLNAGRPPKAERAA